MKKFEAFTLIEVCISLLILGTMLSVSFPLMRMFQRHAKMNTTEERAKLIQSSLVGYYHVHQDFPVPEGVVMEDHGVIKGEVPVHRLGLPEETRMDGWGEAFTYSVDERVVQRKDALRALSDNRIRIYDIGSDPIPFVVESKHKKLFMTNYTIIQHYLPNDAKRPNERPIQNPHGAPPLVVPEGMWK